MNRLWRKKSSPPGDEEGSTHNSTLLPLSLLPPPPRPVGGNAYLQLNSVIHLHIHKGFCFRQGICSSITDLNERLLLEERDLPATPQEGLFEAPPFDEVDIQALAHAVELTDRKGGS
ncbi:hypothetical protein Tco_0535266 [Tanacetum coccineum]